MQNPATPNEDNFQKRQPEETDRTPHIRREMGVGEKQFDLDRSASGNSVRGEDQFREEDEDLDAERDEVSSPTEPRRSKVVGE